MIHERKSQAPQFEVPVQRSRDIGKKPQLKRRGEDEFIFVLTGLECPSKVAISSRQLEL